MLECMSYYNFSLMAVLFSGDLVNYKKCLEVRGLNNATNLFSLFPNVISFYRYTFFQQFSIANSTISLLKIFILIVTLSSLETKHNPRKLNLVNKLRAETILTSIHGI